MISVMPPGDERAVTPRALQTELERKGPRLAYLWQGDDHYTRRAVLHRLQDLLITPERAEFNVSRFSSPDMSGREIVDTLQLLPLLDDWRLVVVDAADQLPAADQELLAHYLQHPVSSSCLICLGEKFDGRSRLYRAVNKVGAVVTFSVRGARPAEELIATLTQEAQTSVTSDAVTELTERYGTNLDRLHQEVEKLVLFIHPRTRITQTDVVALAGEAKGETVFDFLGYWRHRDTGKALATLRHLLARGQKGLGIHSLWVRDVRTLLQIKALGRKRSQDQVLQLPFFRSKQPGFARKLAQDYARSCGEFTADELLSCYRRLWEIEYRIKRGLQGEHQALEDEILQSLLSEARSA